MAYSVTFVFRNVRMSDSTKKILQSKIEDRLVHYADRVMEVNAELLRAKAHRGVANDYAVRLLVHVPKAVLRVKKEAADVMVAMDEALGSLAAKLAEYKELLQQWHSADHEEWVQPYLVEEDHSREESAQFADVKPIVRVKQLDGLPPTSLSEAVFQMEMLGRQSFLFRNSETGLVEMLRKEGDEYVLTRPPQL